MYKVYLLPIRKLLRVKCRKKFYEYFYKNLLPYYEEVGICPHCISLVYGEVYAVGETELNKDISQTVLAPEYTYKDFYSREYYCGLKDAVIDRLGIVHKKDCFLYKHFKKNKLVRFMYSYAPISLMRRYLK